MIPFPPRDSQHLMHHYDARYVVWRYERAFSKEMVPVQVIRVEEVEVCIWERTCKHGLWYEFSVVQFDLRGGRMSQRFMFSWHNADAISHAVERASPGRSTQNRKTLEN